jgi:hypothetical protein
MEGFREIFSTNNPILINQIEHAFKNAKIRHVVKGKKALEIGNIEITGIRGAQIFVDELQYKSAKEVLHSLGIDTEESKTNSINFIFILALALIMVLLYMIYRAYFS